MTSESTTRARWARASALLEEIGRSLDGQDLRVEVRLPRVLAEAALRDWQDDDEAEADVEVQPESPEERRIRHRAGTVGLIGLELEHQGLPEGDPVTVTIQAHLIGAALEAMWGDD